MNKWIKIFCISFPITLILISIFVTYFIITNSTFNLGNSSIIDASLAASFGSFYGGLIGTLLSASSIFLLIYTIVNQKDETQKTNLKSNFFKMIDYHNQHLNSISVPHLDTNKPPSEGKRAFVTFKIQFKRILETVKDLLIKENIQLDEKEIADIAYVIFYYGIEGSWTSFITNKLSRYEEFSESITIKLQQKLKEKAPDQNLARTNQTYLSAYFRNMYNAIKMVDESKTLRDSEKYELITIYRAQISNPELYIIFFNILSRFGAKWDQKNFIKKYEFIKNIPFEYCDGYNPKKYFSVIKFEEDEY